MVGEEGEEARVAEGWPCGEAEMAPEVVVVGEGAEEGGGAAGGGEGGPVHVAEGSGYEVGGQVVHSRR